MIILLLKFLLYSALSSAMFMAYADIHFINAHPVASLIIFFLLLFIIGKVIPAVLMFAFKLAFFFILMFGTAYFLGVKCNIKLPVLPDFRKAEISQMTTKSAETPTVIKENSLDKDKTIPKLKDHLLKLYGPSSAPEHEKCYDKNHKETECPHDSEDTTKLLPDRSKNALSSENKSGFSISPVQALSAYDKTQEALREKRLNPHKDDDDEPIIERLMLKWRALF